MKNKIELIKELTIDLEMARVLLHDTEVGWYFDFANDIDDIRVFSAFGDDHEMGYALYCEYSSYPRIYELNYVFVKEEYRNHKVATELIRRSSDIIISRNNNRAMVSINEGFIFMENTLAKLGFKEYLQNKVMIYTLKDVLNSTLYTKIDQLKAVTDNAKRLSEAKAISTSQVELFGRMLEKEGFKVNFDELEEDFSRYFFEKGKIVGYMAFSQHMQNILYMDHLYISKDATNQFIIPGMILSSLRSCEANLPDDASIIIQFKDRKNVDAIEKSFGIADEYDDCHYWIKPQ